MDVSWDWVASLATPIGLFATVYQLGQARRALRNSFERTFVDRYSRIASAIDVEVLLGTEIIEVESSPMKRAFFDYFELCEEELYFRAHRKVGASVWRDWWYGISMNLRNPNFERAFEVLVLRSASPEVALRFPYLREAFAHRTSESTFEPARAATTLFR